MLSTCVQWAGPQDIPHLQKKHDRGAAYNLPGDESDQLTHYGQSLGEMESFDDIRITSDEEETEGVLCVYVLHVCVSVVMKAHMQKTYEILTLVAFSRRRMKMLLMAM